MSTNRTNYSIQRKQIRYIESKESDRLRDKDIIFESARVSCVGDDKWIGFGGRIIDGQPAAYEFARKLNDLIKRNGGL